MIDKIKAVGTYHVKAVDETTGETREYVEHNIITDALFQGLFRFLSYDIDAPAANSLLLNYAAIGDGTATPAYGDTALTSEIFRKAPSSKSWAGRVYTAKLSVGSGEGNPTGGVIKELGLFAGGTSTPGSGVLLSHAVVSIPKTASIRLLITWTLTFTGV